MSKNQNTKRATITLIICSAVAIFTLPALGIALAMASAVTGGMYFRQVSRND